MAATQFYGTGRRKTSVARVWLRPGAVLDGRDIGTVIAPNANVKLFVTASPEVRASKPPARHLQLE